MRGLSTVHFAGRAQIVYASAPNSHCSEIVSKNCGELIFYLDGAHSPESMEACAKWFSNAVEIPSNLPFEVENADESSENGHILHKGNTSGQFEKPFKRVDILKIINCSRYSWRLTICCLS